MQINSDSETRIDQEGLIEFLFPGIIVSQQNNALYLEIIVEIKEGNRTERKKKGKRSVSFN
jgi:hypothetical protein